MAAQHDVLTVAQALDAGWSIRALRHAADHDDVERLRTGVCAVPLGGTDDRHRLAAAQLRRVAVASG